MNQPTDQTGRHRLPDADRPGDPIGEQIDPSNSPMLTSVSGGLTPDKVSSAVSRSFTVTSVPGRQATPKARLGKRSLAQLATELGERNHLILDAVAEHRFLTTAQLTDLLFADLSPISQRRIPQRVLARLRRVGLLDTLPRRVGGVTAGSQGLIHYLTEAGMRLIELDSGQQRRHRWHEPSDRFALHHLAVADVRIALELAHRAKQLELVQRQVEPATWRQYDGPRGVQSVLKPDLYVETATQPGSAYVDAWFIEVDLGNEAIPTLVRKCRRYEQYRRQGIEQQQGGFPWVLWLLHGKTAERLQRRQAALAAALAADKTLPASLFQILTPDQLIPTMTKGAAL
ncbi:replication-relaxation family protein [Mycobacteroides abscessus]|uniref:replication-relaxation family protein n=1 Tax=Mycobacteroides abscessus TaxID=36809 RepID=UPI001F21C74D|nr:replication-relaxation family protein [Mycobacteroides abscessus]